MTIQDDDIFKKVFDTVDHGFFVNELERLCINNPLLSRFVTVCYVSSNLSNISFGVPKKGRCLSPLLFIIFIDSLNSCLSVAKSFYLPGDMKI